SANRKNGVVRHRGTEARRKPASKKLLMPAFSVPLCLCVLRPHFSFTSCHDRDRCICRESPSLGDSHFLRQWHVRGGIGRKKQKGRENPGLFCLHRPSRSRRVR